VTNFAPLTGMTGHDVGITGHAANPAAYGAGTVLCMLTTQAGTLSAFCLEFGDSKANRRQWPATASSLILLNARLRT